MAQVEIKQDIEKAIKEFASGDLTRNALHLFTMLGYNTDRRSSLEKPDFDTFRDNYIDDSTKFNPDKALVNDWRYVDLLFQLSNEEMQRQLTLFNAKTVDRTVILSYLFFVIELQKVEYSRSDLSKITRELNKVFPMPVMILFKYGNLLTLSIINRRLHKKDENKDVLEKVTLIKDININNVHRAHIEILYDLSFEECKRKYDFTNFVDLHNAWQKTLDTRELNKRFYRELANWYFWAIKKVSFPNDVDNEKDDTIFNSESVIRLLTRLIFIWFIKEKKLIPECLFNEQYIAKIIKNFANKGSTVYYRAILQNLFFATLNQKIEDRAFAVEGTFEQNKKEYGLKNRYRYAAEFNISQNEVINLFKDVPFLNGGLFDCLDNEDKNKKVLYLDGFSRNPKKQANVPDYLFFSKEQTIDLSEVYDDKKKTNEKVKGLFEIFNNYKFTIAENTPIEEEIALDPELLGKVFENLLASYNPETKTTARKQTGSFYTPREIVNYMVDESLKAYLQQKLVEQTFLSVNNEKPKSVEQTFLSVKSDNSQNQDELKITHRHLPHWTMEGAYYFITFRKKEKPEFTKDQQKIVLNHIKAGNNKFYQLVCTIVMPDHVHLILKPDYGYDLSRIMKGIKGVSANLINKSIGQKGSVWQDESFDRIIRNEDELYEKIEYIYYNPVKKELTNNTEDYPGWFFNKEWVEQAFLPVNQLKNNDAGVEQAFLPVQELSVNSSGQTGMSDLPVMGSSSNQTNQSIENRLNDLFSYSDNPNPFTESETRILINAIDSCKILDPACGSGAFPMGILHKMVHLLHKLDPNNELWEKSQLDKVDKLINDAQNIPDSDFREKTIAGLQQNRKDIEDAFTNNELDYGRKLYLIENCIYGVDIQPIAVQIAKLRFFISLIVDQKCKTGRNACFTTNYGIRALPNLETKFVAANTLIGLEKSASTVKGKMGMGFLRNPDIEEKENELKNLRHKYFSAKTRHEKKEYQKQDELLRKQIAALLINDGWNNSTAEQIVSYNPYDQNTSSPWFDPEWMFGIKVGVGSGVGVGVGSGVGHGIGVGVEQAFLPVNVNNLPVNKSQTRMSDPPTHSSGGFDIVIGNPPYGFRTVLSKEEKDYFRKVMDIEFSSGDSAELFCKISFDKLVKPKGILSFIVPKKSLYGDAWEDMRLNYWKKYDLAFILDTGKSFENVLLEASVFGLVKSSTSRNVELAFLKSDQTIEKFENTQKEFFFLKNNTCQIYKVLYPVSLFKKIQNNSFNEKKITTKLGLAIGQDYFSEAKTKHKLLKGIDIEKFNVRSYRYLKNYEKLKWENVAAFQKPKIITQVIVSHIENPYPHLKIIACYDAEGIAITNTLMAFETDKDIDLKFLLGYLNSKFVSWYAYNFIYSQAIRTMHFYDFYIQQLPIPKAAVKDQKIIAAFVDQILSAKEKNPETDTDQLEKRIDEMIYKLYELTDDEIGIIEGK